MDTFKIRIHAQSRSGRDSVWIEVSAESAVFLTGLMQFGYTRGYFTSEDRWSKTHVS
jgi:hypothetical protein